MTIKRRQFIKKGLITGTCLVSGLHRLLATDDVDDFINETMISQHISGIAVCIIKNSKMNWSKGYGWADLDKKIPMCPKNTIQNIGSISKTFTATAVMQLWEKGKFKLGDDVNQYLSFKVENPLFPGQKITFRQLLTHRSSIKDGPAYDKSYACGDPTITLKNWLEKYFTPGGQFYNKDENFHTWKPGQEGKLPVKPRAYSNVAFGLLGHLVETVSGEAFSTYCENYIFRPLGMDHTSWYLSKLDISKHAIPYTFIPKGKEDDILEKEGRIKKKADKDSFVPNCLYSFPNYPDGLVRTSVHQLARFLLAFMQGGALGGTRILKKETLATMLSKNHFDRGLCWFNYPYKNSAVWGHGGGDPGVSTVMLFRPSDNSGIIIFSNTGGARLGSIIKRLF
jgi:CubicO group peptidase (beta-lactamase class C family)